MAAAGLRSTKGSFLVLTLLCLVCFSSARIDRDVLENLKKTAQIAKHHLDKIKEEYNSELPDSMEMLGESIKLMEPMTALMKKTMKDLPADFSRVDEFMEKVQVYMKNSKADLEEKNEKLGRNIKDSEEKLEQQMKLLTFLEELNAEL